MESFDARTEILIGAPALHYLQSKTVFIAGLGGVGGNACEAIARAGIGKIIIVDHDIISPSNINRQLLALRSTMNKRKTEVMQARIADINPDIEVIALDTFIAPEEAKDILAQYQPDFVMDCIDSIVCKAAIVKAAQDLAIPVISAMGAGNRLDVTKVKIAQIRKTEGCPLARELRRHLRELRADLRYPVVYSNEPNRRKPLPHGDGPHPRAVNGTSSYLPGMFGLMMAGYVINDLLQRSKLLD